MNKKNIAYLKHLRNSREWYSLNKEKHQQFMKKWLLNNPDKAKKIRINWRKKNPKKVAAIARKCYVKNIEKRKAYSKKWRKENPEKVLICKRKWEKENRSRSNALSRKWHKLHPGKAQEWSKRWYYKEGKKRYFLKRGIDVDKLTKEQRSKLMGRITSISSLEIKARPLAMKLAGCRLNHQPSNLKGKPDYANKSKKIIVRIQGCWFHKCPKHCKIPKSNRSFWLKKFNRNVERDLEVKKHYESLNWKVIDIWEHDIYPVSKLIKGKI